jgi:hypothetical protein
MKNKYKNIKIVKQNRLRFANEWYLQLEQNSYKTNLQNRNQNKQPTLIVSQTLVHNTHNRKPKKLSVKKTQT